MDKRRCYFMLFGSLPEWVLFCFRKYSMLKPILFPNSGLSLFLCPSFTRCSTCGFYSTCSSFADFILLAVLLQISSSFNSFQLQFPQQIKFQLHTLQVMDNVCLILVSVFATHFIPILVHSHWDLILVEKNSNFISRADFTTDLIGIKVFLISFIWQQHPFQI